MDFILHTFAYFPLELKPGKHANAGAQVMAEVFIVITWGSSTQWRLRRTGVTATSGRLGVGMGERVEDEGMTHMFGFYHTKTTIRCLYISFERPVDNHHGSMLTALITTWIPLDILYVKWARWRRKTQHCSFSCSLCMCFYQLFCCYCPHG